MLRLRAASAGEARSARRASLSGEALIPLDKCLDICYTTRMGNPLRDIQDRVARGRYVLTLHFLEEMRDDHLFLPDILSAIDGATEVTHDGCDAQGDPKYKVPGLALDGRRIEVVCVIKEAIVLVTVYTIRNSR
jgi:hypothetical protein